jgi:hypothetical protein
MKSSLLNQGELVDYSMTFKTIWKIFFRVLDDFEEMTSIGNNSS